jgi:hypothetical protein
MPKAGEHGRRAEGAQEWSGEDSEDVARVKESYTGQYLKDLLGSRAASCGKRQAAE